MPLIAITGGIATGKSTFTKALSQALAAPYIDTDQCARELLENDEMVRLEVVHEFGNSILSKDGLGIRRETLRDLVFSDLENRRKLEAILHPKIRQRWRGWVEQKPQSEPNSILLVEIPLLFETGSESLFDYHVVVACGVESQVERLVGDRGLSLEMARRMIASQMSLSEKIRRAAAVIWNEGNAKVGLGLQVSICANVIRVCYAHLPAAV